MKGEASLFWWTNPDCYDIPKSKLAHSAVSVSKQKNHWTSWTKQRPGGGSMCVCMPHGGNFDIQLWPPTTRMIRFDLHFIRLFLLGKCRMVERGEPDHKKTNPTSSDGFHVVVWQIEGCKKNKHQLALKNRPIRKCIHHVRQRIHTANENKRSSAALWEVVVQTSESGCLQITSISLWFWSTFFVYKTPSQ